AEKIDAAAATSLAFHTRSFFVPRLDRALKQILVGRPASHGGPPVRRPFQRLLAGPFGAIALTLSVAMFPCATAADDNPLAKPNPLAKEDPLASADPFAGRFRSEDMEVVIENVGGRYSGEIRFRGESYRFEARRTDPKLA